MTKHSQLIAAACNVEYAPRNTQKQAKQDFLKLYEKFNLHPSAVAKRLKAAGLKQAMALIQR